LCKVSIVHANSGIRSKLVHGVGSVLGTGFLVEYFPQNAGRLCLQK
jgi:hypothetical protein